MKYGTTWMGRCVGGLAALVALISCGGMEVGERAPEEARPREPRTRGQAVTRTLSFPASFDARVEAAFPTRNFGGASRLVADLSPEQQSALHFSVTGVTGTVTRAVLRLYVLDGTTDGPKLFLAAPDWTERGVTWNIRPTPYAFMGAVGDLGALSSGTWVEYDVTEVVTRNRQYDFVLIADSSNGADFASREYSQTGLRPQLLLTEESLPESPPGCPPPQVVINPLEPLSTWYVSQSEPTRDFHAEPLLRVDASPARLETFFLVDFDFVPTYRVTAATLRLYATEATENGPRLFLATQGAPSYPRDWNTRPVIFGDPIADLGRIRPNTWVEYDISDLVSNEGRFYLGLVPDTADGVDFVSLNSEENPQLRPLVVFTLESIPDCPTAASEPSTGSR